MGLWKRLLVVLGIASASTAPTAASDLAAKAAYAAQQAVVTAKNVDGTILDYSPASLKQIDRIVLGLRREGQKPEQLPGILFILGAYVGEVMVRNVKGASWTDPPKELREAGLTVMGVTTSDGTFWNPVGKVHKLLMNGEEDSVAYFFDVVSTKGR